MAFADAALQVATQVIFVLVAVLALVDFERHRDRQRLDAGLMLSALAAIIVIQWLSTVAGLQSRWITTIGTLALLAHPHLLLRLVRHFRQVPRLVRWTSISGLLCSWTVLIIAPQPLPAVATLLIVAYFALVEGYAGAALTLSARTAKGQARRHLTLAATGSALLALVIALAGVNVIAPGTAVVTRPLSRVLSILAALGYYFGFAPPDWIRAAWRSLPLSGRVVPVVALAAAVTALITAGTVAWQLGYPAPAAALRAGLLAIPLIAVLAAGSAVLAGRLFRPLRTLTAAATRFGRGDYHQQVPVQGAADLRALATEFNAMATAIAANEAQLRQHAAALEQAKSEAEAAARALQDLNATLEQRVAARTAESEQRAQELARSNAELQQFAYVASHDLQEPLRTVASYVQLLARRYKGRLDADADDFIAFAVEGATRMQQLINDLLAYSRVDTRGDDFRLIDCEAVLREVETSLTRVITETGATITHQPLPTVPADGTQLAQLLQNLIANALKFRNQAPPRVHISATQQNGTWIFSVRDNGIGIDPRYFDRIFVIFQRLHGRDEYPGTGIGLAICRRIVERHGGRIWVESQPGQGASFYFSLANHQRSSGR